MSSTTGGAPAQDEAAYDLSTNHPAEVSAKAVEVAESGDKEAKMQFGELAASAASGSVNITVKDGNESEENAYETKTKHARSEEQKPVENELRGEYTEKADSGAEGASQAVKERLAQSKERVDMNESSESAKGEAGEAQKASEREDEVANEARPLYVTSTTSEAIQASQTHDNTSKAMEDITQAPPPQVPTRRRVKVYTLSSKSIATWDDRGTGCVDIRSWDPEPEIVVTSEIDPSIILLESPILLDTTYHMQQDSLIVWNEPRDGMKDGIDLAISFQESQGCAEILDRIIEIQQKYTRSIPRSHRLGGGGYIDSGVDDLFCKSDDDEEDYNPPSSLRLPPVKPKHIPEIVRVLSENFLVGKARLANAILKQNYIEQLCDLFKQCEDLGDQDDLHRLFDIFKILVMLNQPRILDRLFHPDNVFQVMGAFEYDAELARRPQHRHFLENVVVFNQVVHLPPYIVDQIHRSFRIQYMRDVVLPRILDESTVQFLGSIIMFSNSRIALEVKNEEPILVELFDKMRAPATTREELRDLLRFLNELCDISKNLEQEQKIGFYATLHSHGLLDVLQRTMVFPEMSLISVEVLLASIDTDGRPLRQHLLKTRGDQGMLALLIRRLHEDEDTAVKNAITDLLRFLVDVGSMEDARDRTDFLSMFYNQHLDQLLSPILIHPPTAETKPMSDSASLLTRNLIDFVGFLLMHHGTTSRNYIVSHHILTRMNPLVGYIDKHVALSAIRNLRLVLGLKDKILDKTVIKENLLDRVVKLFTNNATRYNLVNSACLDLFTQIKNDSSSAMIAYFVGRYYEQVRYITYTEVFKAIKQTHDEARYQVGAASDTSEAPETPPLQFSNSSGSFSSGRTGPSSSLAENERFQRSLDELDYFESGDDNDDSSNNSNHHASSGLLGSDHRADQNTSLSHGTSSPNHLEHASLDHYSSTASSATHSPQNKGTPLGNLVDPDNLGALGHDTLLSHGTSGNTSLHHNSSLPTSKPIGPMVSNSNVRSPTSPSSPSSSSPRSSLLHKGPDSPSLVFRYAHDDEESQPNSKAPTPSSPTDATAPITSPNASSAAVASMIAALEEDTPHTSSEQPTKPTPSTPPSIRPSVDDDDVSPFNDTVNKKRRSPGFPADTQSEIPPNKRPKGPLPASETVDTVM